MPLCGTSDVKKLMNDIHVEKREHLFDVEIAAYLVNPLIGNYAHEDLGNPHAAGTTFRKMLSLMEKLSEADMKKLFDEIEMPLVFTLHDMEESGYACQRGRTSCLWGGSDRADRGTGKPDPSGRGGSI